MNWRLQDADRIASRTIHSYKGAIFYCCSRNYIDRKVFIDFETIAKFV